MSSTTSSPDPEPVGPPDGADRSTTHRQPPGTDSPAEPAPTAGAAPISAAQLAELVGRLGRAAIDPDARRAWAGVEQAELINVIDQLERLNSARAALPATTTDAFTHAHTHARTGRTPTSTRKQDLLRRSINSQIALATTPRRTAANTSAWPAPWSTRCRTCTAPWPPAGPANTAPSWPSGKPPCSPATSAARSTRHWPTSTRSWATGAPPPRPPGTPTGWTPNRPSAGTPRPSPTAGSPCAPPRTP